MGPMVGRRENSERTDEVLKLRRLSGLWRIVHERVGAIAGYNVTVRIHGRFVRRVDGDFEF